MFSAPHVSVNDLSWSPIGPGPDPAVLIEARMVLNQVTFRLLGFRVPMPFSAGWSRSAYWEDDKALQGEGLLWDLANFKDFVQRVDDASIDEREPVTVESEAVLLDESMLDLATTWHGLTKALRWSGQDWCPAVVNDQPYILLGYPEGPARPDLPTYEVTMATGRTWFGKPQRQHHFNLRIHGMVCGLACAEVRALGSGGKRVIKPLNQEAAAWIAEVDATLDALPGSGPREAFAVDGKPMYGMIAPVDVETWCFDVEEFVANVASGLHPERMRWTLDLPMGEIGDEIAQLLEGLSAAVRTRAVSRIGNEVYFACRLAEAPGLLGLTRPPEDGVDFRAMLYASLGKVTLRALGRKPDDTSSVYLGRVVQKIFIFPDTLYLCLSTGFTHLASAIGAEALLQVSQGNVLFETPLITDTTSHPDWIAALPTIIDRPIRDLVDEVAGLFDD